MYTPDTISARVVLLPLLSSPPPPPHTHTQRFRFCQSRLASSRIPNCHSNYSALSYPSSLLCFSPSLFNTRPFPPTPQLFFLIIPISLLSPVLFACSRDNVLKSGRLQTQIKQTFAYFCICTSRPSKAKRFPFASHSVLIHILNVQDSFFRLASGLRRKR
jgi:hypothetical protein